MTVRVRYTGTELTPGVVEDFPEADNWRTTEAGEVILLASHDDDGQRHDEWVGVLCEGRWDSVVITD